MDKIYVSRQGKEYINPPARCNLCDAKIDSCFYDGKTLYGYWANMCASCYIDFGYGPDTTIMYSLKEKS